MSNENTSGSFTHAFLPGLILGLVIGAAAGAFLPDIMGGSKIPADELGTHAPSAEPRDTEGGPSEEDIQDLIDEAEQQTDDAADAVEDAIEDATTPDAPSNP